MCSIPREGWVGIIYHNGLKNYEHYTPAPVEGIYRDWQKCCEIQARLAAKADEIGYFRWMCLESETHAIAQFENWKAHAVSLKRCDRLLKEPENYEIENFFAANNIKEFGTTATQMQYEYNANLSAHVCARESQASGPTSQEKRTTIHLSSSRILNVGMPNALTVEQPRSWDVRCYTICRFVKLCKHRRL